MALIHCPECDKEVSDTAKMCPHCGYDIARYIQQIEQQKKKEQEEQERQEREQKLADYAKTRIENRNRRIREEAKPLTISYFKREIICAIISGFFFFAVFLSIHEHTDDIAGALSCLIMGGLILFFGVFSDFNEKHEIYHISHTDFDKYVEYLIQKADKAEHDSDEAIRKARLEASFTHTVRCPNCGSINVEKVSNAERLTSIVMMGPASKKIGKQYKCKNCGYLW